MRNLFAKDVLALESGRAISGIAPRERTLRVISGRVWLTIEGALEDHWLEAGDAVTLTPHRLIVLEADGSDSRIESGDAAPCVRPGATKSARWPAARRWIAERLAGKGQAQDACCGPRMSHCHGS